MAYPTPRSCNEDLCEGMTDGKYKKIRMNRGGLCEETTYWERSDLNDVWYGIHESRIKQHSDSLGSATPNFQENRLADPAV